MSSLYAFIRLHGSERETRAAARALAYGRRATVVSIHRCVSARLERVS